MRKWHDAERCRAEVQHAKAAAAPSTVGVSKRPLVGGRGRRRRPGLGGRGRGRRSEVGRRGGGGRGRGKGRMEGGASSPRD